MNNPTKTFFLLVLAGLFLGCATLPEHQSNWVNSTDSESSYRFYDAKSRIRYNVENDSTHVYIKMDVLDAGTKVRMLRTGTKMTFSRAGKKQAFAELEFPFIDTETPIEMDPVQQHLMPRDGSVHELSKLLPKDGLFTLGDSLRLALLAGIESNAFLVEMKIDNSGALLYSAEIPLSYLSDLGQSFNLGFETGAFSVDDPEYEQQLRSTGAEGLDRSAGFSQNRMNPNSPMGGGNQPYGNVYQPGRTADPYRANPPRLGVRSALSDPISFWVQVNLRNSPEPGQ